MVLGDETFTTLTGEEINRDVLVQEMIDYYNEKYPNVRITDFNEGSEIRNLLEAIAVDIYHLEKQSMEMQRIPFLSTSYGRWLDLIGTDMNLPRNMGTQSYGVVTFTIPDTETSEVTIPAGTVLKSNITGLDFLTQNDAIIAIGETSVDCTAYSRVVGTNTNADPSTITVFETQPYNGLAVTNTNSFVGGTDSETDDEYRARLQKAKESAGFGSKQYYINLAESVPGVHDVILTTASGYTGKFIVNGDAKPIASSTVDQVFALLNDETKILYNHSFITEAVTYTTVPLEIECSTSVTVDTDLITSVLGYLFNGGVYSSVYPGLSINESLSKYVIMNCLESIPGILQVTDLTSDETSFSKLEPASNKVLKLGTVTVTQNVES